MFGSDWFGLLLAEYLLGRGRGEGLFLKGRGLGFIWDIGELGVFVF